MKETLRLGTRDGGLRFNSLDSLKRPSSPSKQEQVHVLVSCMAWRAANGVPPEWENTATGITPVRKAPAPKTTVSKPNAPGTFTPLAGLPHPLALHYELHEHVEIIRQVAKRPLPR